MRYSLVVLAVVAIVALVAGLLIVRTDSVEKPRAQPSTSQTEVVASVPPTLGPSQQVLQTIATLAADAAKPKFIGEKNGFRFVAVPGPPPDCAGLPGGEDAKPEQILASPLNFSVGYLPQGVTLAAEGGNVCRGVVVALLRNYGQTNSQVTDAEPVVFIGHIKSGPDVYAEAPEDRLEATTLGGRQSVIQRPRFALDPIRILMKSDLGYFALSGRRIAVAELLKIAESVQ